MTRDDQKNKTTQSKTKQKKTTPSKKWANQQVNNQINKQTNTSKQANKQVKSDVRGTYSHFWMSRALQSFISTRPKMCSSAFGKKQTKKGQKKPNAKCHRLQQ